MVKATQVKAGQQYTILYIFCPDPKKTSLSLSLSPLPAIQSFFESP